MSFAEIITETFKSLKSRMGKPFVGSFVIAWIVVNWRPILIVLFAESKIIERIDHVEDNFNSIQSLFLYPLYVAIFYNVFLEYFLGAFDAIGSAGKLLRVKMNSKFEAQQIKALVPKILAEREFEETKAGTSELRTLNLKNENLKDALEIRDNEVIELQKSMNELQKKHDEAVLGLHNLQNDPDEDDSFETTLFKNLGNSWLVQFDSKPTKYKQAFLRFGRSLLNGKKLDDNFPDDETLQQFVKDGYITDFKAFEFKLDLTPLGTYIIEKRQ